MMSSSVFALDSLQFEVNFTKRLNSDISLYRLRERTSLKIVNPKNDELKAKIILTIMKGSEQIFQTNIHQAPILKISEGDNYFEADILITNEASHIVLKIDSSVHFSYDLFYVREKESLQHRTLYFSAENNEDETVSFNVEEIVETDKYRTLNDIRANLTEKYLPVNNQKVLNISESAVAYFQMQQGLNQITDANKFKK